MKVDDGTTVTFKSPRELDDAELDVIEEHVRRIYGRDLAELVIEALYGEDTGIKVDITEFTMTVKIKITGEYNEPFEEQHPDSPSLQDEGKELGSYGT